MATRLDNYLRTYRRRTGLTQNEVAFLLGFENRTAVSRYEKRHRLPPLETALACEIILGAPVSELFAGIRQGLQRTIRKRVSKLEDRWQQLPPAKGSKAHLAAQKLKWLESRKGRSTEGAVAAQ
jgi:transcriptional regulator with XRE-family HTH domain